MLVPVAPITLPTTSNSTKPGLPQRELLGTVKDEVGSRPQLLVMDRGKPAMATELTWIQSNGLLRVQPLARNCRGGSQWQARAVIRAYRYLLADQRAKRPTYLGEQRRSQRE